MKIDKSLADDYAILSLKGEFDTFYCPMLQEEVEDLIDRGIDHVVLDLRLVKFINSTALGAIIKAHKRVKAEGGELVVAQPSNFVRDIIGKVGIDQIVTLTDSNDDAVKHITKSLNARELAGDVPVDREKILVTFPDDTRNQQIGGRKALVGRMSNVDGSKAQFLWSGTRSGITPEAAGQLFFEGSDINLKFQVKLIKKGYIECKAKVTKSELTDDGVRVTASFDKIGRGDREALEQFAEDMEFLKQQLPGRN